MAVEFSFCARWAELRIFVNKNCKKASLVSCFCLTNRKGSVQLILLALQSNSTSSVLINNGTLGAGIRELKPGAAAPTSYLRDEIVEVVPWPGNNPIENLRQILKDKVSKKQPTSTKHFCKIIKMVLVTEMTAEYCQALVHSMPSQL